MITRICFLFVKKQAQKKWLTYQNSAAHSAKARIAESTRCTKKNKTGRFPLYEQVNDDTISNRPDMVDRYNPSFTKDKDDTEKLLENGMHIVQIPKTIAN